MKTNGFHASVGDQGGNSLYRKLLVASLIMALLLASVPVACVFAAPPSQQGGGDKDLEQSWASKLSQLRAEVAVFNNLQTKPGQNGNNANIGQYLDKYRAAIAAAQALVVSGSGFDSNGRVTNQNQANQSVQQLGMYLSTIRGLRQKIAEGGRDNNNNNNGNSNNGNNTNANNGAGIPVTGSSADNNNQSSGQNNNNNNQNNSPAKIWGVKFRELQAAQTWFNNFRTKPGQNRNSERISRYLDQYAFALRQANAIIVNGANSNGQGNNGSNGQTLTQSWGTPQQQLAMYLSMMRGLRQKIAEGGNNNNNTGTNNTAGNNTGTGSGTP